MKNTILRQIAKVSTSIAAMLCLCMIIAGCNGANSTDKEVNTSQNIENESSSKKEEESSSLDKVEDETEKSTEKETEKDTEENTENTQQEEVVVKITSDLMQAPAKLEDILLGKPVTYERYEEDGFTFEYLISDYEYESYSMEDAVLVISSSDNHKNYQAIKVSAEGAGGWKTEKKFIYEDVNFDGKSDMLICTGYHGNLGFPSYYCFLRDGDKFVEEPSFTDICFPAIDKENKIIRGMQRSGAACHIYMEYKYIDGEYKRTDTLVEYAESSSDGDELVWVWTVNGEEVYRAMSQTDNEPHKLFYAEESRWGIGTDRWDAEIGKEADYRVTNYE